MKKTFSFRRPARAAACLAALALLLPAAVFAASHGNHDGWSMLLSTDSTLNDAKYYMARDLTIDRTVRFQHDGPQTFCLAGRTLTVNLTGSGGRFVVTTSLTVENCGSKGGITVNRGPINVYEPLTLTSGVTVNGEIDVMTYQNGTVTQIGSLTVESGSTVNGTITVESGTTADISGTVNGAVTVEKGGIANISGKVTGRITVESGANLTTNGADLSGGVDTSGTTSLTSTTVSGDGVTVKAGTCTITGGTISNILKTGSNGGGVYVEKGTCILDGTSITGNTAQASGGSGGSGGGVYVADGECIIRGDTQITGNTAQAGNGGGVYLAGGSCTIQGNARITGNAAQTGKGGGVYVASGECTIDGSAQVGENTAGGSGGGVYVQAGSTCWIREYSIVHKNRAGGDGGGVCVEAGSSFLLYSYVQQNTAFGDGGGVYLAGPAAGVGGYNMDNATIYDNEAESGDGGGIYAGENVKIGMAAGSIDSNTAHGDGGGVYLAAGGSLSTTTKITNNKAETGSGGGVWATSGCTIFLNGDKNNIVGRLSENTAKSGRGMYVNGAGWTVEFNGAKVYENDNLYFAGSSSSSADYSALRIVERGAAESTISGNIQAINVDVTMDKGTVRSGSVVLENAKWLMNGGYCNISRFKTDGRQKVWLYGGYFDAPPSDKDNILVGSTGNPCVMFPISGDVSNPYFDPAYKEGYSYGVYAVKNDAASLNQGTITYDSQPVVPGEDFTIIPNGTTLLEYSCTDAAGSPVSGWPTNAGAYTIRAKCLNAVEKWYAETSFDLTIAKATPAYTEPTGLTARLGKPLSDVALPQGWAWKDGSAVPEQEGTQTFLAVYTPADTANYNTVELDLTVQVEHAHVGVPQPEQPATCTEPGVKAYYECSVCGAPFKDAACDTPIADLDSWKVIQALGHDWGVWASNGDDTHTRTCRRPDCGEVEKEACTGGEATYFLQAVCERCGGAYGPLEEDTRYPAGEISVEGINDTIFDKFLDPGKITFDSFVFGRSLRVSITADDDSQHVGGYTPDKAPKVEYYIHSGGTALSFAEVQQKEFTPYQGVFTIRPDDKLVIYAKITDYAGNTAWISSDGIVLDATAPAITGVENGASYYVTQALKASDENLNTVAVNGDAVAADFTLTGDTKATYAVVVTDKAGNVTSVTVEMKPLSDLEKVMEGLTEQTVTSGDRPRLQALEATLKGIDLTDATQAEKDKVESLLARCQALLTRLDWMEWTPSPTATPVPTAAPAATPAPKPAATAKPTPAPTATPEPSAAPEPSASAEPTATPEPLPTESPAPSQGQEPASGFPWGLALLGLALAALIGLVVILVLRRRSDDEQQ